MFLKYISFMILVNQNLVNSFDLFGLSNPLTKLNKEFKLFGNPDTLDETAPMPKLCWIKQKLDHFDTNELRTWKMRYYEILDLWQSNGPVYIFIGMDINPNMAVNRFVLEIAKETQGAIFVTEHRYYGESQPLNKTADFKHFKFLSSRQGLADLSILIKDIKSRKEFKNSKVVTIGGSYAGNLATWMRLLYPGLVDAAYASSAPVLAKVEFSEFYEKVSDDIKKYGTTGCLDSIRRTFKRYNTLIQTSEGIDKLRREEYICIDCNMTLLENKQCFFDTKMSDFGLVSLNGKTAILEKCIIFDRQLSPKIKEQIKCYDYDLKRRIQLKVDEYKAGGSIVQWIYQSCTEFGYFTTTSSKYQPFTDNVPLNYFIKVCMIMFGDDFDQKRVEKGVVNTNKMYGGKKPNVTYVVFTNGEIDPLNKLGVLEDLFNNVPSILIPGAAHAKDLYFDEENETKELKQARERILDVIKTFIGIKL